MNRDTSRELNRVLKELRQYPGRPHMAVVTGTAPLKVRVAGEPTSLTAVRIANYTPTVNDTVLVLMGMGPVLIVGKIIT